MLQAIEILKKHLLSKRLAHAYLLVGPYTPIMQNIMMDFARSVHCLKQCAFERCDCAICQKIVRGSYPDVHWIGQDTKAKSIKIEEIRNLISEASLKPFEGNAKIFLFPRAHRLTPDAANAFLKTLEEPAPSTTFVLQVESKSQVLDTLRSRCFEIRFYSEEEKTNPLALDEIFQAGWIGWLDQYQNVQRAELLESLGSLMESLRERMTHSPDKLPISLEHYVEAIEKISETKEALEHNVNQKLALTRLAVHLERMPQPSL